MDLAFPDALPVQQRGALADLATRNLADHGEGFLGLVLTGSAARGIATELSDLDVLVVLSDDAATSRRTARSPEVDEIPVSLTELSTVPPFGSQDWWYRWQFAWAPVLLDRTGETLATLTLRHATVTPEDAEGILIEHDRLDGWINFAYRALKSDRDSRALERHLDAVESVPWLLDVIWSLAGRVRPYNKYLPWELRHHPLPDWSSAVLLDLLGRTLVGDPTALRETFARVDRLCRAHDAACGHHLLGDVIDSWGGELTLLHS